MPRKTSPTLTEALARYMRVNSDWAPSTTTNVGALLRKFVRDMGPEGQVHRLERERVEDWLLKAADHQMPASFNKLRSRVIAFLKWCIDMGWLDYNPAASIKRRKVMRRERFRLSAAELLELPSQTDNDRDCALLHVAINTALRGNEIAALRVRDVDLDNSYLHATISKSGTEDLMPISVELESALRAWLSSYAKDAGALQPDWFLFPTREPGHGRFIQEAGKLGGTYDCHLYGSLIPDKPMRKPWEVAKRAMIKAGHTLEAGEGCHTIRRSVARAFFDMNAAGDRDGTLRTTSALLHHKNGQTTETYLGVGTERLARDEALRGKRFLTALVPPQGSTASVTRITPEARNTRRDALREANGR